MNPRDPNRLSRHQRLLMQLGWWLCALLLFAGVVLVLVSLARQGE